MTPEQGQFHAGAITLIGNIPDLSIFVRGNANLFRDRLEAGGRLNQNGSNIVFEDQVLIVSRRIFPPLGEELSVYDKQSGVPNYKAIYKRDKKLSLNRVSFFEYSVIPDLDGSLQPIIYVKQTDFNSDYHRNLFTGRERSTWKIFTRLSDLSHTKEQEDAEQKDNKVPALFLGEGIEIYKGPTDFDEKSRQLLATINEQFARLPGYEQLRNIPMPQNS